MIYLNNLCFISVEKSVEFVMYNDNFALYRIYLIIPMGVYNQELLTMDKFIAYKDSKYFFSRCKIIYQKLDYVNFNYFLELEMETPNICSIKTVKPSKSNNKISYDWDLSECSFHEDFYNLEVVPEEIKYVLKKIKS